MSNIIPLVELYENPELQLKRESLNYYLNQNPPESWVKVHPYISNYRYLPIDKVEWLLRKFYKKYRIEILSSGTAFNGVCVTVRIHYLDPITAQMEFHDGIGAAQIQTKKGSSPADLSNINQGAISMAFPIAKTIAIKDACDHLGKIFGSDLNRKDVVPISFDEKLSEAVDKKLKAEADRIKRIINGGVNLQYLPEHIEKIQEKNFEMGEELFNLLKEKQNAEV